MSERPEYVEYLREKLIEGLVEECWMPKKKKGSRYTPPKKKPDRHKPWWMRRAYAKSGDRLEYLQRVLNFLEFAPVDEKLTCKVVGKTKVHI